MSAVKYDGIEKYIFADVYTFFLKYNNIPNEDYYWECCVADAKILRFKYKEHPLASEMIMSVMDQLTHKVNNTQLRGYTHMQWEQLLDPSKKSRFK